MIKYHYRQLGQDITTGYFMKDLHSFVLYWLCHASVFFTPLLILFKLGLGYPIPWIAVFLTGSVFVVTFCSILTVVIFCESEQKFDAFYFAASWISLFAHLILLPLYLDKLIDITYIQTCYPLFISLAIIITWPLLMATLSSLKITSLSRFTHIEHRADQYLVSWTFGIPLLSASILAHFKLTAAISYWTYVGIPFYIRDCVYSSLG